MFCKDVQYELITFFFILFFVYSLIRLSGLSPFMGDTDMDTMSNVTIGKYSFKDDAFNVVSENAKDFIRCLLLKDGE